MATLDVEYKGQQIRLEGDAESVMAAMEAFSIASALAENQERQNKLRAMGQPGEVEVEPNTIVRVVDRTIPSVQVDVTKGQYS